MDGKLFEREMLIRTLPTTILQIVCKILLYFQVSVKNIKDADDNLKTILKSYIHPFICLNTFYISLNIQCKYFIKAKILCVCNC